MKNYIKTKFKTLLLMAILIAGLAPINSYAQSPTNKLFDKYSGKEDYTSVYITKYMFDLFSKIADEKEDKEFKEATSKLDAIKILTKEEGSSTGAFYKELLQAYKGSTYKELMVVKDGKEEIKFLINEKDNKISELVMIVGGNGEAVLIVLQGDINLKQISKLSKSMKIEGMEHLDNMKNEGAKGGN